MTLPVHVHSRHGEPFLLYILVTTQVVNVALVVERGGGTRS